MLHFSSDHIKKWAIQIGFDLVGIAPAEPIARGDAFRKYIAAGYHGGMKYLAEAVEARINPRKLMPWARSIICTGMNYFTGDDVGVTAGRWGRIARYARGQDYHQVVKVRLRRLAERIRGATSDTLRMRCFVDSGPLAEKAHAARAGLGWIGRHGLLVNEQFGSWLVLGEIVTDLELEYDEPQEDGCGSCRRCLEVCPTHAIVKQAVLDARRCISYLTVEAKSEISQELAGKMGNRLFGCDLCQEVCPFNAGVKPTNTCEFQPRPKWSEIDLAEVSALSREQFTERFAGSSIIRAGRNHFISIIRNCQKNLSSQIKQT